MKPIKVFSKTVDRLKDGRKCTPYQIEFWFFGNVLFSKKPYTNKWFKYTGACLHVFGFRFTKGINTNN